MANLTSAINVNVPSDVKDEANKLFNNLGLNMSTAINIFLKRAIYERGIPFEIKDYDPFYSKKTQKRLIEAYNQLRQNKGTEHEIIEVYAEGDISE